MTAPADPLNAAVDRIMRTWSLIKLVPKHRLPTLRTSLLEELSKQCHLTEDELVILGFKYLHHEQRDAP
jgi:hypothetical protein